jgi:hypothetical protein
MLGCILSEFPVLRMLYFKFAEIEKINELKNSLQTMKYITVCGQRGFLEQLKSDFINASREIQRNKYEEFSNNIIVLK